MKSEHQNGKTEPASHSTVWGFGLGNRRAGHLRNAVNRLQSLLDVDSMSEAHRAGIFVESDSPTVPAPCRSDICRPDGAGDCYDGCSTKMPRLRRSRNAAVPGCGCGRRLAASSSTGRDARPTRRRDVGATMMSMQAYLQPLPSAKSPFFPVDLPGRRRSIGGTTQRATRP
jgi:hypothetical protein